MQPLKSTVYYFGVSPSGHPWPLAENILNQDFTTPEPDRAWVADMTYIWTSEGWLYLAVIIDLFSRRVVGWSMAEHLRTEVVLSALEAALGQRRPAEAGLLFHCDRGSQYASGDYQAALQQAEITCSMSRRGNCWDTQSMIQGNIELVLTRAGIGCNAFALTCRLRSMFMPTVSPLRLVT